ncbi:ShlB/FhaC/HecB family hemolysin secretion/activation protein [Marinobacter sp. X15-166B]|uniref:ShlB/FhaC/HecB family hemolysin secretion/activation protein n=1 Tax=Marinobacter sp. X15-166B TaxID=1897620 RepID=UPI00114D3B71|nr:ShlB/FhaC/HecB family hemolysin secretion/activation protein [Marinobacter sp. X15-166B]
MRFGSWLVLLFGVTSCSLWAEPGADEMVMQCAPAHPEQDAGAGDGAPALEDRWSAPSLLLADIGRWVARINPKIPPPADSFSPEMPGRPDAPGWLKGSELHRHWRNPRFELLGDSQHTSERGREHIGLAANNLLHARHSLNLEYRAVDALRVQDHSKAYGFNYAFPVASNWFELGLQRTEYQNTAVSSAGKHDVSGDSRVVSFSGRRAMHRWRYLRLDGRFAFSERETRVFEAGRWVKDSLHQISRVQFDGYATHELGFEVQASTRFSVIGGVDVNGAEYRDEEGYRVDNPFHKYVIAGSLRRQLWLWSLGVSGRYQFSPDDMPASEYMKVAGPGLISGFAGRSLRSPVGGWLRVDAASPPFLVPFTSHLLSGVRLSVLQGWMPDNPAARDHYQSASAAELSVGLQTRGLHADISVGSMLEESPLTSLSPHRPDVSVSLFLEI